MTFGQRMSQTRKTKKMSQAALGKLIGIDGDALGRYERGEVRPSIEVATNIANALEVSLDYLVGQVDLKLDKRMIRRIEEVSKMKPQDQEHVFALLDAFIKQTKLQGVLQ